MVPLDSSRTAARLVGPVTFALLVTSLALTGCGSGKEQSADGLNSPPRVSVSVPGATYAGTTLPITITVTGCNRVDSLAIYDGKNFLRALTYQAPALTTELLPNEVPYVSGIATTLSLNAQATCDDGRSATSQPQPVSFLPVAAVILPPEGSAQAVPDTFTAQGSDATTTFTGCTGNPNGTTSLVRVNVQGQEVSRQDAMPVACSNASQFTDRNGTSGTRWTWAPLLGAMSLDDNLGIATFYRGSVNFLSVGPDGDAVMYDAARAVIQRLSTTPGGVGWSRSTFVANTIMLGPAVVQADGRMAISYFENRLGTKRGPIAVTTFDYRTGNQGQSYELMDYLYGELSSPNPPPAFFNANGTSLYLPIITPDGNTTVYACNPYAIGCDTAPQWRSQSLKGKVVTIVPFADGTKLAAVASNYVWFLDAASGTLLNKAAVGIKPTGNYVMRGVTGGKASDFYILTGKADANALPLEVIVVDDPSKGELVRFETGESSLMVGVADDGQSWLRLGSKLVKPLTLQQYRQVRP